MAAAGSVDSIVMQYVFTGMARNISKAGGLQHLSPDCYRQVANGAMAPPCSRMLCTLYDARALPPAAPDPALCRS